jgi:hypothetical protein
MCNIDVPPVDKYLVLMSGFRSINKASLQFCLLAVRVEKTIHWWDGTPFHLYTVHDGADL